MERIHMREVPPAKTALLAFTHQVKIIVWRVYLENTAPCSDLQCVPNANTQNMQLGLE